ncbi:MAG: hypothetical protein PHF00_11000 [Elusimicrobia bacterium]|nr:hypothetical protein [Elusimicrobiota bacterium]
MRDVARSAQQAVQREALAQRAAIAQTKARGKINVAEAAEETARLDRAVDVHLCYIQGSIVPRVFAESFGENLDAAWDGR